MSEKQGSKSAEPQVISRRAVLTAGGALALKVGIDAALPNTANAQLISPEPPQVVGGEKPASKLPPLITTRPPDLIQEGFKEPEKTSPEKVLAIKNAIDNRADIAENFLFTPEGETPPNIMVNYNEENNIPETEVAEFHKERVVGQYPNKRTTIQDPTIQVRISSKDKRPLPAIVLEANEMLAVALKDSNQSLDLVTRFNLAYQKFMGARLTASGNGQATPEELVGISDAAYLFDFSSYTDGKSKEDIFIKRKNLAATFLVHSFAIWMSESEQLPQMLKEVSQRAPEFGSHISSMFLFSLRMLEDCANNSDAFNKLRIKKRTIEDVSNLASDNELKHHFKGKGI
jgi:hypothetical protein